MINKFKPETTGNIEIDRQEEIRKLCIELRESEGKYREERRARRKITPEAQSHIHQERDLLEKAKLNEEEAINLISNEKNNTFTKQAITRNLDLIEGIGMDTIRVTIEKGYSYMLPQQLDKLGPIAEIDLEELNKMTYNGLMKPVEEGGAANFRNNRHSPKKYILQDSEKFEYPPPHVMFNDMLKYGSKEFALYLLSKHPKEIAENINLPVYFRAFIERSACSQMAVELKEFFGVTDEKALDISKEFYLDGNILRSIYYFPMEQRKKILKNLKYVRPPDYLTLLHTELSANHQDLINNPELDLDQIAAFIYDFDIDTKSRTELATRFFDEFPDNLPLFMDTFPQLTPAQIEQLSTRRNFYLNLHKIPNLESLGLLEKITPVLAKNYNQLFGSFYKQRIYKTYLDYGEFEGLGLLMRIDWEGFPIGDYDEGVPPIGNIEIDRAVKTHLETAVNQENHLRAQNIISWARKHGVNIDLDEEKLSKIAAGAQKEAFARENNEIKRNSRKPLDTKKVLIQTHISELLLNEIRELEFGLENPEKKDGSKLSTEPQELPLKDRVALTEIKNLFHEQIDQNFEAIKIYIVAAIANELRQQDMNNTFLCVKYSKRLAEYGTDEEVRVMLQMAATKFSRPDEMRSGLHGGEPWRGIAELGLELWQNGQKLDSPKKISLLNRVYDAEHNFGNIMDKDVRAINHRYLESTQKLLFEGMDFEDLVKYGVEQRSVNPSEADEYLRIFRKIRKAKTALTRPKGYE